MQGSKQTKQRLEEEGEEEAAPPILDFVLAPVAVLEPVLAWSAATVRGVLVVVVPMVELGAGCMGSICVSPIVILDWKTELRNGQRTAIKI